MIIASSSVDNETASNADTSSLTTICDDGRATKQNKKKTNITTE